MSKINIGFISTSNTARLLSDENICEKVYGDTFNVYSAGTDPRSHLVCDTTITLQRNYSIITDSFPKDINEIHVDLDIVILMGDDVEYNGDCKFVYNFELLDHIHKLDEIFDMTCCIIKLKLEHLVGDIKEEKITIYSDFFMSFNKLIALI